MGDKCETWEITICLSKSICIQAGFNLVCPLEFELELTVMIYV